MPTLKRESGEGPRPGETPSGQSSAARREQFIPLRKADLDDALLAGFDVPPADGTQFRRFARMLHAVVHSEFLGEFEALKDAYAPFDPDSDTQCPAETSEEQRDALRRRMFDRFEWLLSRGNFIRLAEEEINAALNTRSHWGLHLTVDFELFDRLELYYRGDTFGTRYRRRLLNRFRPEEVRVPIYQRLVVIFRLRPGQKTSRIFDTEAVYIKLFKEIPKLDLDMLLPETQVRMTLLDRMRVMLPTLTGIGIAVYKMVWALALTFGSTLALLGLIGGTVGYGVRSLYGYLNTRQKYQLNLTQSLYYQNIDNNAGVIHRLLDEADEQENREVLISYFFLWRQAPQDGWTAEELDRAVEHWLHAHTEQHIDFEIADALNKLKRFALAEVHQGRWKALPIERAISALVDRWSRWPDEPAAGGEAVQDSEA